MKYGWLIILPLLFAPNLGLDRQTAFGTLTLADFLIGPYLFLVWLAAKGNRDDKQRGIDRISVLLVIFLWWALIATVVFPLRFAYATNLPLYISLLKLAKLSVYGLAGVLTINALADEQLWSRYYWALLVSGCIVGISLFLSRNQWGITPPSHLLDDAYIDNIVSVTLSILICYLIGLGLTRAGTRRWRIMNWLGLIIMGLGFVLAPGRGGWLAALAGITYILIRLRLRRVLFVMVASMALIYFAYNEFPSFRFQIDNTLWPDQAYLEQYDAGIAGIDDGARLSIWLREGKKLAEYPVLGRGFFHRGGVSGLWESGSHNFFVQMFLETGIVGGVIILLIFWSMWRQGGAPLAVQKQLDVPSKAALIAAIVAALGGEYFYGGTTLFTLLAVYGTIGSLPLTPGPIDNVYLTRLRLSTRRGRH